MQVTEAQLNAARVRIKGLADPKREVLRANALRLQAAGKHTVEGEAILRAFAERDEDLVAFCRALNNFAAHLRSAR